MANREIKVKVRGWNKMTEKEKFTFLLEWAAKTHVQLELIIFTVNSIIDYLDPEGKINKIPLKKGYES